MFLRIPDEIIQGRIFSILTQGCCSIALSTWRLPHTSLSTVSSFPRQTNHHWLGRGTGPGCLHIGRTHTTATWGKEGNRMVWIVMLKAQYCRNGSGLYHRCLYHRPLQTWTGWSLLVCLYMYLPWKSLLVLVWIVYLHDADSCWTIVENTQQTRWTCASGDIRGMQT